MKQCPYCGEDIQNAAKKCRHCSERLEEDDDQNQRKCPFCKKNNPLNSSSCSHCGRVLIERTGSSNASRSQTTSTQKKTVSRNNGAIFSRQILSFLKRFKRIVGIALVIGIISLISFLSVDKYLPGVQSSISTISSHVKSVAQYQGIKTNSLGVKYEAYLYENSDLNITLFYDNLAKIKDIYFEALAEGKIDGDDKATFIRYYKTIYFFILGEIIDRAYADENLDILTRYENEVKNLKTDSFISSYLDKNLLDSWLNDLGNIKRKLDDYQKMAELKKEIDVCNSSCSVYKYNSLVDEHNSILRDFNSMPDVQQNFFEDTMKIIDVSILFPTQDHLDLVGSDEK